MGDLGKIIAAKGFKKSNKLPNLVTLRRRHMRDNSQKFLGKIFHIKLKMLMKSLIGCNDRIVLSEQNGVSERSELTPF